MDRKHDSNVLSAFTEEQVSRLTGLSVSRLRYWDRTDFLRPSLAAPNRREPFSRIYSFADVAALRVIAVLINQYGVSVKHLRQVVRHLESMDNAAWTRTTLYVFNRKVIFADPETQQHREIVSGQYVIGIPLEKVLSDTQKDVRALSERGEKLIGQITRARNVAHNSPVIAGTRIPIRSVKEFFDAGYSVEEIIKQYPTLTEADVKAALSESKAA